MAKKKKAVRRRKVASRKRRDHRRERAPQPGHGTTLKDVAIQAAAAAASEVIAGGVTIGLATAMTAVVGPAVTIGAFILAPVAFVGWVIKSNIDEGKKS